MFGPRLFQNDESSTGKKITSSSRRQSSITPVTNRVAKRRSLITLQQSNRDSIENDRRESIFFSTPARVNRKRPSPAPPVMKTRPQLQTQTAALATAISSSSSLPSSASVAGPPQSSRTTTRLNTAPVTLGATSAPTPQQRDTRPLRDKRYQELISAEIHSFLIENKFEIESGVRLTESTLKAPTQKEFIGIFIFLVKIQNPTYKFIKSPDSEIYATLKILNYPYIDSISRSQIGAVGGQNWPTFLGVLYWLVTRNLSLLILTEEDETPEDEDRLHDQYQVYITSKYSNFLHDQDEDAVEVELQEQLEEMKLSTIQKIEEYNHEKIVIDEEITELEEDARLINSIDAKAKKLFLDFNTLNEYIESYEAAKPKREEVLDSLEQATIEEQKILENYRAKVLELQFELDQLGVSKESLEKLHLDKDRAEKEYNNAIARYNELKLRSDRVYDQLTNDVEELKDSVSSLENLARGFDEDFRLLLNNDIKTSIALAPEEILNHKTSEIKREFIQLRERLNSALDECKTRLQLLTDEREKINKTINMLEIERDKGERRVKELEHEYDKKKRDMDENHVKNNQEIDRLDEDLKNRDSEAKQALLRSKTSYKVECDECEIKLAYNEKERKDLEALRHEVVAIVLNVQTVTQEALLQLDDQVQEEVAFQQSLRNK